MTPLDRRRSGPSMSLDGEAIDGPDRSWQAIRYLLGEVSAEETTELEAAMVDDQELRDLLADSVEFLGAVRIVAADAMSRPVVPRRSTSARPLIGRKAFLGAIAASAIVASCRLLGPAFLEPSDEPSALASKWADIHGLDASEVGPPSVELTAAPADHASHVEGIGDIGPVDPNPASASERPLPSWLIAATTDEPGGDAPRSADAESFEEN